MAVALLCQHLKPTIVDCLRNFEEGRNLDFVSTQLGHAILSVQQADALACHGEPDGIIQNLYSLFCVKHRTAWKMFSIKRSQIHETSSQKASLEIPEDLILKLQKKRCNFMLDIILVQEK